MAARIRSRFCCGWCWRSGSSCCRCCCCCWRNIGGWSGKICHRWLSRSTSYWRSSSSNWNRRWSIRRRTRWLCWHSAHGRRRLCLSIANAQTSHINAGRETGTAMIQGVLRFLLELQGQQILSYPIDRGHVVRGLTTGIFYHHTGSKLIDEELHRGQCRSRVGVATGTMQGRVAGRIQHLNVGIRNAQELTNQSFHSVLTGQMERDRPLVGLDDGRGGVHHFGQTSLGTRFVVALYGIDEPTNGIRGRRCHRLCQFLQMLTGP